MHPAHMAAQTAAREAGRALTGLLSGEAAPERAMLTHSLIAGVWLLRTILGVGALADADPVELADQIARMLAPVLDDHPGS